ncbi:hypothetical protein SAMN04488693_12037 [Arthrobacter subterraneus]|uniref:ParB-like nuclease domain-containing protein n=1 Tax=Arthrobacter subterraneus TaxID=335973 RepID=A0A1G8MX86_9MICC|nr:hypothetical protein [Arthrobacter subterraneus]SDI72427.1 hypothetical protein SAMN04488693_12037 [Arthrobacter subterraneus]
MAEKITIGWRDLRDLDLDPDNPRHERGLTRSDVIAQFVKRENIRPLARDIVQHGLSPLERFGAIKDAGNDLVVVEGNRRLCALMLLHDPSLAPTPEERRSFERLSRSFDPSGLEIELEVFSSREEANIWLERKHLGENNGLGTRGWNPVQQARHFGDTGNTLALALIDYAADKRLISPRPDGILTTVTRFLSNPFVRRHALLITTGASDAEFSFNGTRSLFNRRLQRLLTDIINSTNGASSRTTALEREEYARKHLVPMSDDDVEDDDIDGEADLDDNDASTDAQAGNSDAGDQSGGTDSSDDISETSDHNASPDANSDEGSDGGPTGAQGGGTSSAPSRRLKLVDPDAFHPSLRDNGLRRILLELHLVTRRTPALAAIGVRIFIEAITVAYLENRMNRTVAERDKLHVLAQQALADLSEKARQNLLDLSTKEKNALRMLHNQVTNSSYVFSAAYLGAVAHGSAFPTWEQLTAAWDEIAPILMVLATNCEAPLDGREE